MALSGIELSGSILIGTTLPMDAKYGPYYDTSIPNALALAISEVTSGFRYQGLTVGLVDTSAPTPEVVEYWFKDGVADVDLVLKESGGAANLQEVLEGGSQFTKPVVYSGGFLDINYGGATADPIDPTVNSTGIRIKQDIPPGGGAGENMYIASSGSADLGAIILHAQNVNSFPTVPYARLNIEQGGIGIDTNSSNFTGTAVGDMIVVKNLSAGAGSGSNYTLGTQKPSVNLMYNVCQPISTSTNWPDNSPGINWYFQAGGPLAQKWTPTANNPRVRRKDFMGTENAIDVVTTITAMSDNFNNIQWVLKIVDPGNPLSFTDLAGSLLPSSPAAPLVTIGGSYGSFGPGWTENTVFSFNLGLDYFDLYGDEGQLELHIYNNGANGSIITGCSVQLLSA